MDACPDIPPPNYAENTLFVCFLLAFVPSVKVVLKTPRNTLLVAGIVLLGVVSVIDFLLSTYPALQAYSCFHGVLIPSISDWFDVAKRSVVHFDILFGSLILIHWVELTYKKPSKASFILAVQLLVHAVLIAKREAHARNLLSNKSTPTKSSTEGVLLRCFVTYLDLMIVPGFLFYYSDKAEMNILEMAKPENFFNIRKAGRSLSGAFIQSGILYTGLIGAVMFTFNVQGNAAYTPDDFPVQVMGIFLSLLIRMGAKHHQELLVTQKVAESLDFEQAYALHEETIDENTHILSKLALSHERVES